MGSSASFSEVGDRYAEQLARGLRLSGEPAEYYERKRIERVRDIARDQGVSVRRVLDFGCGRGTSFALLQHAFPDARLTGFEPSEGLGEVARGAAEAAGAQLVIGEELGDMDPVDVVYCNGVFHHITPPDRPQALESMSRVLRPDGIACVWENSPFNPGTRLVMSRIPFDRGASLLTPREMRALQRSSGLAPVGTEFHFIFPRVLSFARGLEHPLRSLPFGGQYVVVGRREARHA
jgi:SAM-dependent methyltransferase